MPTVELCVRIIDPQLDPELPIWGSCTGAEQGAALEWLGTLAAAGVPLRAGRDGSIDDGAGLLLIPDPDSVDVPVLPGRPVLSGPPPAGAGSRLAAIRRALGALAVPDLRGVVALRLDDPGSALKHHLDGWAHEDVPPAAWEALWDALGGDGRASVFCCPGWVTADGRVIDSRSVNPGEWSALDEGVKRKRIDLECHGFTHLDPALEAWTAAPDRATNVDWYRELWPPRLAEEPSVDAQEAILARWQAAAGRGTAVVAPGEAWGLNTIRAAQRRGFVLFNSWEICRLDATVPTWSTGVGSPYLDEADACHLVHGLPTVGYWHDRDMAVNGPGWVPAQLEAWRDCGARRFAAFADLARAYATPVAAALVDGQVVVRQAPSGWPLRIEQNRGDG